MLVLPYTRPWYDDETLGSWFNGLRLLNGEGAWRSLLKMVGYGPQSIRPSLAARYDQKMAALLGFLGTTYESAILKLTTIPFWLAFDALPLEQGKLPGTHNLPMLPGAKSGQPDRALQRWCPMCLIDDCAKYGEPYWHRSHQLPNIFVCWQHHCALWINCPSCGHATVTLASPLPRLRCGCGYDLRRSAYRGPISAAYLRLLQVSRDALTFGAPLWDPQSVRNYLADLLDRNDGTKRSNYLSVLSDAFGDSEQVQNSSFESGHVFLEREFLLIEHSDGCPRLILTRFFSNIRAPECCALLAAMDKSFDAASLEFRRSGVPSRILTRRKREDLTITRARRDILAGKGGHIFRKSYWFLRFHDSKWFETTYPRKYRGIPSIHLDRMKITLHIKDRLRPASYRRKLLLTHVASVRASLRDQRWYSDQLRVLDRQILDERKTARDAIQASRVAALIEALEHTLREEKKPRHITIRQLASLAGMSHTQAEAAMRFDPLLRNSLDQTNNNKVGRQLVWAGQQLRSRGISPSYYQIYTFAGLPSNRVMALKKTVMAQLDDSPPPREKVGTSLLDSDEILGFRRQGKTLAEIAQAQVLSTPAILVGRRLYLRSGLHTRNTKPVHLDSHEVLRLRKEGKSFATIGKILGVRTHSIARVIRSMNDIDPQLRRPMWHRANCDPSEVAALRERGYSIASIASLLEVSTKTVQRVARRLAKLTLAADAA
jgi:uncharacterized protein YerC